MSMYALPSKTQTPSEVPCFDGLDQFRHNRVVQACIIEVCELVRGGAFVKAVGIRGGWCG